MERKLLDFVIIKLTSNGGLKMLKKEDLVWNNICQMCTIEGCEYRVEPDISRNFCPVIQCRLIEV